MFSTLLDLHKVSFDLDPVPLGDLLEFRFEHRDDHKAYMRSLRGFMVELAETDGAGDREQLLRERLQEIGDAAHGLRSVTRSLGKTVGGFSLGLVGTAWSAASGDILGAVLGAAGVTLGLVPSGRGPATAYSYLFASQRRFA
ncbi:MAG: hypothetical protein OXF41_07945 [bacterium]|nr:hypothetical protein [bacterium]